MNTALTPSNAIARVRRPAAARDGMRRARLDAALVTAIALALFGYPLAATLSGFVSANTRDVSLPYRALVAALTLFIVARAAMRHKPLPLPPYVSALCALCLAVLTFRFVNDVVMLGLAAGPKQGASEFVVFFFGVTLLPALALLQPLRAAQHEAATHALFWVGVLTVGFAVVTLTLLNPEVDTTIRTDAEGLNAITFASTGALLVMLAWSLPLSRRHRRLSRAVQGGAVALSLVPLVLGASKGPIVSLLGALALSHLLAARKFRWPLVAGLALGAAALAGVYEWAATALESGNALAIVSRLSDVDADSSTVERLVILSSSWGVFVDNPWLGGALVEPLLKAYPHNILLEALMVGGIGFGLAVLLLVLAVLTQALRLLRAGAADPFLNFVGMQAVFVISMSMLSGSLYRSPDFWAAVALVFSCSPRRPARRAARRITTQPPVAPSPPPSPPPSEAKAQ